MQFHSLNIWALLFCVLNFCVLLKAINLSAYLCYFITQAYLLLIVSRVAYFILYDTYNYLIVN